jgi:tetratricopeptide (TPR) repeat protein/tRNA A-37 threonylcarbamoyl transferase component Bud32
VTPSEGTPAQSLGRYTVLRKIGAGGMAEVFLARFRGAQGAEKLLVVKKIHPAFASNPRFIEMFVDEAKVAMRLNHSNIVQVYAFEQIGDDLILAMEHVDGRDLHEIRNAVWNAGQRVPYGLAAFIAAEVAKGLDYAHSRKDHRGKPLDIVHRDVSPQNVLVSRDGAVKVTDFGIARARSVHEESLGEVRGKLGFMAPEQARGLPVDRRADIFSLGVILHELLVGRPLVPFGPREEVLEIVRSGLHVSPRAVDPAVPEELDAVVRRAMAVDPRERYATAREMAVDLGRYLHFGDAIHDSHALETWMAEHVPAAVLGAAALDAETGGATAEISAAGSAASTQGGDGALGQVEQRAVVLVAARVAIEARPSRAAVNAELVRLADEIAFKGEGVLHEVSGGLRIYLGLPHSSVEDAIRGVRLAYDLLDVVSTLSEDHRMRVDASIAVVRGTVRSRPEAATHGPSFEPGEELLAAAGRLLDATPFGEIAVGGGVYRLARQEYNFSLPERLPGNADGTDAQQLFKAYRARGPRSRTERSLEAEHRGTFRGREAELARLEQAWRRARAGRAVLVKIVGELGIGKSRLAARFAERAAAADGGAGPGPALVRAECLFAERDTPLAGAVAVLRASLGLGDGDGESDLDEALRTLLAAAPHYLARQIRFLRGVLGAPDVAFAKAADRQRELVRRVAFGLGVLLGALSRDRGALVVVENAHWLDGQSVDVLSELAGLRAPQPILCLLVGQTSTLAGRRIAGLEVVELAELPDDVLRDLAVEQLGDGGDMTAIVDQIVGRAQGNPFFANEIIDSLFERRILVPVTLSGDDNAPRYRQARPGAIRLPTTMEGLAASHIDDLDPSLRTALRVAAVLGARFTPATLGALVGRDVAEEIRALTQRGFLVEAPEARGGETEYRFRKPMVREAAYAGLSTSDRHRLHRAIADGLIAGAAAGTAIAPAAHIAWHLENGGDPARAGEHYLEGGDAALRIYSNRQALRLYDRALALLPRGSATRYTALERRQKVLRDLGDHAARDAVVTEMERIAEQLGDAVREAQAVNARALLLFDEGEFGDAARQVQRALEIGSRAADFRRQVESMRLLAYIAAEAGHLDRALDCCDWALRIIPTDADPDAAYHKARVLGVKGLVLMMCGDLLRSPSTLAQALVLFRRLGKRRNASTVMSNLALLAQARGDLPEGIDLLERAILTDREIRDLSARGRKLAALGGIHVEAGEFDEGQNVLEESRKICRDNTEPVGEVEADLGLAGLWLERGDPEGAGEILAEVTRRGFVERSRVLLTRYHQLRTKACLALGNVAGALEAADLGSRVAQAAGMTGEVIHGAALRGLALLAAGRQEEALAACDRMEELVAVRGGVRRAEEVWWNRARVLHGAGDAEGANAALVKALEEVERKGDLILKPARRAAYNAHPLIQEILVGLPV